MVVVGGVNILKYSLENWTELLQKVPKNVSKKVDYGVPHIISKK